MFVITRYIKQFKEPKRLSMMSRIIKDARFACVIRSLDNFDMMRKPNSIIVLLYIQKLKRKKAIIRYRPAFYSFGVEKLQNSCQFNGVLRIISFFLSKVVLKLNNSRYHVFELKIVPIFSTIYN
jgi:hypothetical protein